VRALRGSPLSRWRQEPLATLREYDSYLVAETELPRDDAADNGMRRAMNQGFRRVAGFIFGKNVGPSGAPEKVAMTAPVRLDAEPGSYRLSFLVPRKYTRASLPVPDDAAVHIREVPKHTVACLSFNGNIPDEPWVAAKKDELRALVEADGGLELVPGAEGSLYQYHPPFAPAWQRVGEVVLPVRIKA
jgi:hypothetical protein